MGRPFSLDLKELPGTYTWALDEPNLGPLERAIASAGEASMVYVGSGGSFTGCLFGAQLHTAFAGRLSRAATPLDAASITNWTNTGAMVLTAGGRNPDVLGIFRYLVANEPPVLGGICAKRGSPLGEVASLYSYTELLECEPPAGRDGFLATKSTIAACVFLYRAYAKVFRIEDRLPDKFEDLYPLVDGKQVCVLKGQVFNSNRFLLLHGSSTIPAAFDVESKLNESGLADIEITDYRNFAHGRHTGLFLRRKSSAVIALFTAEEKEYAAKTLSLIPKAIPVLRIEVPGKGHVAALASILAAFLIAKAKGDVANVDIGRPRVPAYGRQLYNRNVWNTIRPRDQLPIPVRRKLAAATLISPESKAKWILAYDDIIRCLRSTRFDGVVLDYDGTLCDPQYRFSALPMNVASELERIVRLGAAIGIATGRGKSVRKSLQKSLPSALWSRVMLGYYNCSQIAFLDDERMPDNTDVPSNDLQEALKVLSQHPELTKIATLEARGKQITVSPVVPGAAKRVRELVADLLSSRVYTDVKVVYSTHSIDILSKTVSKLAILSHLEKKAGRNLTLLRIGDLGTWPGNDFELLSSPTGISCHTVSAHLSECWNLAPVGERNSQATIYYLRALRRITVAPHPSFALRLKKIV